MGREVEQSHSLLQRARVCVRETMHAHRNTVTFILLSYGRLPTHSSRREFGITDTERATAVAIEAALRSFARAHVSVTLLSSDGAPACCK